MFRPIDALAPRLVVTILLDGEPLRARDGVPLAVALLEAGAADVRRTPVSAEPRGPYCLMGACFECLVEVDGRPNVQACATAVREGMRVRRQIGARHTERQE
jgi:D-hydroxyproline dehydrogenase subunit gamma